jgi:hypothetical protein
MVRKWNEQEDILLKNNYQTMLIPELSKQLNRTHSAIKNRVHKIGLKIDKNSVSYERMGWKKPGETPHNKGKKMSAETYKKCSATMFKKGNVPKNITKIGTVRLDTDGYLSIKTEKGYKLYNRFLWEQHHGKLKKDDVVKFIDGNPLNCVIENLYLSDRVSHMKANTIQRYPKEVIEIIKINSKVKKLINEGTRQS